MRKNFKPLFVLLLLFSFSFPAKAASFNSDDPVDIDKSWIINFSKSIFDNQDLNNLIKIYDSNNNALNLQFEKSNDNKTLSVSSLNQYEKGVKYTLVVNKDLKSTDNHSLGSDTKMEFTTKNGSTYYVSPDGNDTNNGSTSSPFKTISKAVEKMNAGDTLLLRGGTYYERLDLTKSGNASSYYTIKAYPGETPILDGSQAKDSLSGDSALVFQGNSYWKIDGLSIQNYHSAGIYLKNGANNINMNNLKIYSIDPLTDTNYGCSAIFSEGNVQNCSVTNSDIHNVGLKYDRNWHHGIYITGGAQYWKIDNNKIHDNGGSAIHLYNGSSFSGKNITITNNTLYNNHKTGLTMWTNANNNTIKNNIFYNNTSYDLEIDPTSIQNTFTYNTFGSHNSDYNIFFRDPGPGSSDKNTLDYNKYYKLNLSKVVYAHSLALDYNKWRSYSQESHGQFFNNQYTPR